MKVSVVIPVHDAAAFLPECIASLRAQELSDMEFLFVDDGSRDGSAAVLRSAAAEDPRIQVITFPENRGVSAARNAGIEAARGDYIGFCDADDTVEPQQYRVLYEACVREDCGVSFCRVFKDREGWSEDVPLGFPDGTVFNRASIRSALLPAMLSRPKDGEGLPLSGYTPRNLFRRDVLGSHRFREDIHYAEDLLFIAECLLDADRAVAIDRAYYHYRFHAGSVTKRYSPYIPESFERSNAALTALLGGSAVCMRRMTVRRRKMAVDVVRNFCAPGSPGGFFKHVRQIRAYLKREDIRGLYADVDPKKLPMRTCFQFSLMKGRHAFLLAFLFSYVFAKRV